MKAKQLGFNLNKGNWGGRRSGSGRRRLHSKGVSHRIREKVSGRTPIHINFKFRAYIRNKQCLNLLKKAILNSRKHGLSIIHFSLQTNHIHLIVEAPTNEILTRGMRSLTVTFAKGLNKGKVQIERYHLHVLKTLKETRNAVHYVLFNKQKHEKGIYSKIDGYSSILSAKNGLKWIQEFAIKQKVTLKVEEVSHFPLDPGRSYLILQV